MWNVIFTYLEKWLGPKKRGDENKTLVVFVCFEAMSGGG